MSTGIWTGWGSTALSEGSLEQDHKNSIGASAPNINELGACCSHVAAPQSFWAEAGVYAPQSTLAERQLQPCNELLLNLTAQVKAYFPFHPSRNEEVERPVQLHI